MMNQVEQPQNNNLIVKPTTKIQRLVTIIIMIGGVGVSQVFLWGMIMEYQFSFKFFFISLFVGPGALAWGLANYKQSKFWDSYYGKRIMFRSTK